MSQLLKVEYEKNNAIFADGIQAYTDKNSLYSAELALSVTESNDAALAEGVLLEPISYDWAQETFTLYINKHVTSDQEYDAIRVSYGYSSEAALAADSAAGWTYLGIVVTDVE
jgi:hypothetical protein